MLPARPGWRAGRQASPDTGCYNKKYRNAGPGASYLSGFSIRFFFNKDFQDFSTKVRNSGAQKTRKESRRWGPVDRAYDPGWF